MSTFIELGVGFNPDLPARENVMINATMLGLSPREARNRFDQIIDFAELGEFTEVKLKNYSSGMMVRLAFSVMIQVDADILLIDEVLAVGDAAFQQKCFEEFERIKRSNTTVLLVTHDMGAVNRFCDRAMLLEHGTPVEMGAPQRIGMRYLQLNFSEEARALEAADEVISKEPGALAAGGRAACAWATARRRSSRPSSQDEHGGRRGGPRGWSEGRLRHPHPLPSDVEDPVFAVAIENSHRDLVFQATTQLDRSPSRPLPRRRGGDDPLRVRQRPGPGPLHGDPLDRPRRVGQWPGSTGASGWSRRS